MKPFGFPRRARLRGRWEFTRAQRGGEKIHVRFFLVFALPSVGPEARARRRAKAVERGLQRLPADLRRGQPLLTESSTQLAPLAGARLGVTVTKKVGNSVVRNRIKRWVREGFRLVSSRLPRGLDLVVVAKHNAAGASFAEICSDLDRLVRRPWTKLAPASHAIGGGAMRRAADEPPDARGNGSKAEIVLKVGGDVDQRRREQEPR